MTSPQTENGFTRIANEILEAIQMYKFSLNEMKIIMCVWRFTYGFNRKSHALSLSFFENHTGLSRTRINASLKKLIEANVIERVENGDAKRTNSYKFNKHYNTWKIEKYAAFNSVQIDTSDSVQNDTDTSVQGVTIDSVQNDTVTSVQTVTDTSVQIDTQERKVKETLKKDIKTTTKKGPLVVDEGFGKLTNFYSDNIAPLTPQVSEVLGEMCDELNSELALLALQKSVLANANHKINYTFGIIRSWKSQNFKTAADVEQSENRKRNQSQNQRGNVTSLFEASPETLERQRRTAERYKNAVVDTSDLPY